MAKMTKTVGKKISTKVPAPKMTKNKASMTGGKKIKSSC
jgi:hypothetical protein